MVEVILMMASAGSVMSGAGTRTSRMSCTVGAHPLCHVSSAGCMPAGLNRDVGSASQPCGSEVVLTSAPYHAAASIVRVGPSLYFVDTLGFIPDDVAE